MRLRLDLASPRQPPSWAGWLLLAAGLGFAFWAGWRHLTVQAEYQGQQARLARLTPQTIKPKPTRSDQGEASPALAKARSLLAADWPALLAALERTRPPGIALLAVNAEAGGGVLNLSAEARDHAVMLAYVKTLAGQPGFWEVALTSHTDVERAGEKAVNFGVKARWRLP